jgi:hypothetical protein
MSLSKLVENPNFDSLYSKPECHVVLKTFFDGQEHHGFRHIIFQNKGGADDATDLANKPSV